MYTTNFQFEIGLVIEVSDKNIVIEANVIRLIKISSIKQEEIKIAS
jgi:hypothetical protein